MTKGPFTPYRDEPEPQRPNALGIVLTIAALIVVVALLGTAIWQDGKLREIQRTRTSPILGALWTDHDLVGSGWRLERPARHGECQKGPLCH